MRVGKVVATLGSVAALLAGMVLSTPALASAEGPAGIGGAAPGGPGALADWTPANKTGFGTAVGTASKVWLTLQAGRLSEVYYPDLGTPSVRDLDFIVTDGQTFAERAADASTHETRLADASSLTYQLVNKAKSGRWKLVETFVTDPSRSTLLIEVRFTSLTRQPYRLYVLYDPSLSNNGMDDSGSTQGETLLAADGKSASALRTAPQLTEQSSGYLGVSDGWTDISQHFRMTQHYRSAPHGNVVQTGGTSLNGVGRQQLTLALGFGENAAAALDATRNSLDHDPPEIQRAYQRGWHAYLRSLKSPPASLTSSLERQSYAVSEMVLAASEDKTYRGAFIASPTMPWAWGTGLENPSGAYHLVWSRDLYEMATTLIAAGDRAAAERALDYLFNRQQKSDGSFPQNSTVDGAPHWTNLQLDEVADPIILAYQLGRSDAGTWSHVKAAAEFIVNFKQGSNAAPWSPQERWENQSGYSPATMAAEIAGLVAAAQIAQANGDSGAAQRYLTTADAWQQLVEGWTVTSNGPYSPKPYYLRLAKDGNPNAGTTYSLGDSGPGAIDQRAVIDPSFLELVRLGVKPASDPAVLNTLQVVDQQLGVKTPTGQFWHRYNFDGYGETVTGAPWNIGFPPNSLITRGRAWPIFAGERGEYALAAGNRADAATRLAAMANTTNDGFMLPEQVWDNQLPSGQLGFPSGKGTFSATPLAWTHAQFVRLAWSVQAGYPVEQPAVVACRYAGVCR